MTKIAQPTTGPGGTSYRQYFRRLSPAAGPVAIDHHLGCFPLVDVYELLPVTIPGVSPLAHTKFLLYGPHEQVDLSHAGYSSTQFPRVAGIPWEYLLGQYQVTYSDETIFEDLINDFLTAFLRPPAADAIDFHNSKWIEDHCQSRTVADLKRSSEWDDIRWFVWPRKIVGAQQPLPAAGSALPAAFPSPEVEHLSYSSIILVLPQDLGMNPDGTPRQFVDLMITLRG